MYDRIESIQFSDIPDQPPPDDFDDEDDDYLDDEDEDDDEPSDPIEDLRDQMASTGLTTWGQGSRLSVTLRIADAYRHPIRVEVGVSADFINDRGEVFDRDNLVAEIRECHRGREDTPEVAAIRTALLALDHMRRAHPTEIASIVGDVSITVEVMGEWATGSPTRFVFNPL